MISFEDDEILTLEQVAAIMKVPPKRCARWRSEGFGPPFFMLHCKVRYKARSVRAWLDAQPEFTSMNDLAAGSQQAI